VALAALALAAVVQQRAQGYDLRSRCLLVPDCPLTLELVAADGSTREVSLSVAEVNELLKQAHEKAKLAGMGWDREPVKLKPASKLVPLVKRRPRRSRCRNRRRGTVMLPVGVDFRSGRYVATAYNDRDRAEWPAAPGAVVLGSDGDLGERGRREPADAASTRARLPNSNECLLTCGDEPKRARPSKATLSGRGAGVAGGVRGWHVDAEARARRPTVGRCTNREPC
jgi:hypothetical protein